MNIKSMIKKHTAKHEEMLELCRELREAAAKVAKAGTGEITGDFAYDNAANDFSDLAKRFEKLKKAVARSSAKISEWLRVNAEYKNMDGKGRMRLPDYSSVTKQDTGLFEYREAETMVEAKSDTRFGLDFVKTSGKRSDGGGSSCSTDQYKARDIKTGEVFDSVVLVRQYTNYHYPSMMDSTVKWWVHVRDGEKWVEALTYSDYEYSAVDKVAEHLGRHTPGKMAA